MTLPSPVDLRFEHIAGAGQNESRLGVGDEHHRLEPAQIAVGAPILGKLHAGAHELARILFELRLETLEQGEGIGGGAGKAADHFALGEPAHFFRIALDDGLPDRDLAVAADDRAAAFLDHDDRGRVPAFPSGRMILHEKLSNKRARRGRLEGKGFCVSIYGLAAGGARAAMRERGAPGRKGRARCEKTGAPPAIM